MTHIETDALMSVALGEQSPDPVQQQHLTECSACSRELAMLTRTVRVGRTAENEELIAPPADVWSRIHSELHPEARPAAPDHVARPKRTRSFPRPRVWVPVAASALVVGLVAGAGAGIWWQAARPADSGIVIAGAELAPFPSWPDARGSAVVEQRADGTRQVVVDVDPATENSTDEGGLREVWLIRRDGSGLISIGFLDGTEGRFDVPSGIDLAQYPLVDVSAEQDDGDPAHSGNSIVRGELGAI